MKPTLSRLFEVITTFALAGMALCAARLAPAPPVADARAVPTFSQDIAPVLYKNCLGCHRSGQIGPFPLASYADAKKRATQIATVTQSRFMPPWKAEPGWGDFHGARRLSDAQIAALRRWADNGAPEGDPKTTPAPPHFASGWQIGTPDVVLRMPKAFTVPADGPDVQQCFVVPIVIPQDEYVVAYEFRPSNARVVHHALLYTDGSGVARQKQAASEADGHSVGYPSFGGPGILPSTVLGSWVPGTTPLPLLDGVAKPLPMHSDLVIQTHFHPTGKLETERSTLGLYFAKKPPQKLVTGIIETCLALDIPPGDKHYTVRDSWTLPVSVHAISIQPHAHLLCREMKMTATLPNGSTTPLIWIKDWDWNWQGAYQYAHPLPLPAGTRLDMTFVYDNSADNIHNPNSPPQRVRFGEQTRDEMALCGLEVIADDQSQIPLLLQAVGEHVIAQYFGARVPQSR